MPCARRLVFASSLLATFPVWIALACTSHVPEYALEDGGEAGEESATPDAPSEAAPDAPKDSLESGAPSLTTHVRFALWSPDTPGVDFCVAPRAGPPVLDASLFETDADAGSDWIGPLIGQQATLADGGINAVFESGVLSGLAFPQTSAYFELPAGGYDVRVVASGSSDCASPLLGNDADGFPSFVAGGFATVAVVGDYVQAGTDPVIRVVSFRDDTTSAPGDVALRFIAAVPSAPSLDFALGAVGSPDFRELFAGVGFATAGAASESDAGKVDSNGYLTRAPLDDATLTALSVGGIDTGGPLAVAPDVTVMAGSVATVIAVGGKSGGLPPLPELVLCYDTAPAVESVFSDCSVLSSTGDGG
jgi:hypothetical protein